MSGSNNPKKPGGLVDYSKVSDRPVEDERFQKHRAQQQGPSVVGAAPPQQAGAAAAAGTTTGGGARMSSNMEAVVRLMTGREERTIKEKLADANRPTWEQYKKDNEDKLNLEGLDQRKMEEYRRELDAQRDKILSRGINHKKKKKKKKHDDRSSDSSSSSDDSRRRRKKRHKKKKRKRKKRHDSDDDSSSSEDEQRRRRKRKKHKKKQREKEGEESDGSHYRLSTFFNEDDE